MGLFLKILGAGSQERSTQAQDEKTYEHGWHTQTRQRKCKPAIHGEGSAALK
jgi:hypothetical protein